ncbi:uncharacterized protein Eint_050760 [Encephalitozoon intestinalis ATCC 50506]|uniref:WD40 domain-containing protein n=1 Tax=Encephalitozoon intestinalis (strain ATCC 50506) TaxID=876142 RepID=E0S796_ENCIT|nr:uncharacterized protein Eint_050760 [Encephalitozoon intestinalis ATCC 50506]ADM11524.1 hypothetical protein Eint_050760 [Encephalitozoon intestinalis ATCC 50506]UTX45237.1 WD40 domain-containing protein [Encephalitozoon intestinalis]
METEVYAVDFNPSKNILIYGGGDERCIVMDLGTGDIISIVENFNDSIIFCKFVDDERFIVGSLNGTISLMTLEDEINSVEVGEDISKMKIDGDKLLVGTAQGNVHLFSLDLCIQNVCIGQHNEIQDICYERGKAYTLSEANFMVFDAKSHQKLMDLYVRDGSAMDKIPGSDVVCLGLKGCALIRKNAHLLGRIEIEGSPECILYMNNYFIVGGDFDHILLINMPMGMRTFKIPIEGMSGISRIRGDGENRIVFGTFGGVVGFGDIRDEKSFKLVEGGVGCIFDLCFKDGMIYVGGEEGFNVVDVGKDYSGAAKEYFPSS